MDAEKSIIRYRSHPKTETDNIDMDFRIMFYDFYFQLQSQNQIHLFILSYTGIIRC